MLVSLTLLSTAFPRFGGGLLEPAGEVGVVLGALLGPEGSGCCLVFQRRGPPGLFGGLVVRSWPSVEPFVLLFLSCCWWGGGGGVDRRRGWSVVRPYLENCIVDASIFVLKLVRAHGGCLGTRSR